MPSKHYVRLYVVLKGTLASMSTLERLLSLGWRRLPQRSAEILGCKLANSLFNI